MPDNPDNLLYRVSQLEHDVEKLENRWDLSYTDLRVQVVELAKELAVLHNEFSLHVVSVNRRLNELEQTFESDVKGLRKLAWGAGSAVLVAAITFAITSLAVYGGPG